MADFVLYALLAGLSLALVAGPLGSFVVWRRMSYFGDTLAHSALLGIALALLLDLNIQLSIIFICVLAGILLVSMSGQKTVATDTLLGILAHSALAIGVVLLAISGSAQVSLEAYLFGELLTISTPDLVIIVAVSAAVLIILLAFWNQFLSFTVHEELASIEGIAIVRFRYLLIVLMAVTTAAALKIVGVLLITSLLIIPPAAARQLARSPEQMAAIASGIGCCSVLAGLYAAFQADTPVGPSIVVAAVLFFLVLYLLPLSTNRNT